VHPRTGDLVPAWQLVNELVAGLDPWLGDDAEFVTQTLARVRASGNGAQRQRAAHDKSDNLADVLDALAWTTG
jgi:carboxylate-amine ligase